MLEPFDSCLAILVRTNQLSAMRIECVERDKCSISRVGD